jgi:hypothetical protein
MRLNPTVHDEFTAGGQMTLVFRRDANHRISGRNVCFERAH